MAADQERADRIRALKDDTPTLTWRAIADAIGVTERAAAEWARSGGIAAENAEKLANVLTTAGTAVDFDYIWHGPRNGATPSPFAQADQVQDVRDEFRKDVDALHMHLDRLEQNQNVIMRNQEQIIALLRSLVSAPSEVPPLRREEILDDIPAESAQPGRGRRRRAS